MSDHEPYEFCCIEHYPMPASFKSANEHLTEAVAKILERDGYTVSTETPSCQSMPFATVSEPQRYDGTDKSWIAQQNRVIDELHQERERLRTENERLRAIVKQYCGLFAEACEEDRYWYAKKNEMDTLKRLGEQAKALGIEVSE